MSPQLIKKLILDAYLAGANSMYCGCYERLTKADAREWYDNEFGINAISNEEGCDCCDDEEDDE